MSSAMGHVNAAIIEVNPTCKESRLSIDGDQIMNDLTARITITFRDICKKLDVPAKIIDPNSKAKTIQQTLLDDVSGQIHPGEICALMGPSGSGKTTLLNVLAGRKLEGVSGTIWLNNQVYEKNMKRMFGYVLQEDIFFEELTVKQQFTCTALLRLPKSLSKKDKLAQVEHVVEQLRLEKCSNTPIKLLSGGEKKRVNIGTELLTNPSVLFLDEPTSGLDSTSAVLLISVLRELAVKGKTILTSIHQPSSQIFQSFDQLILLADGKTIFMGKPGNALAYCSIVGYQCPPQYNPADFLMDLVNQDMSIRENLKEIYVQNRYFLSKNQSELTEAQKCLIGEPTENEIDSLNGNNLQLALQKKENKWPIGFVRQTMILFSRNWLLTSKSQFSKLNIIQALCISILYGLLWLRLDFREDTLKDRSSFLFFMMIFWPLEVCFQGVLSIPSERAVINKERASGSFRLSAYYVAKCLSESPLKLVLPTVSFTIAYWMANLNPYFPIFLGILAFLLLIVLVAESFGVLLGALFRSVAEAWVTGNVFLIGSLLVGGYFIDNIPSWLKVWIKWISFYKYTYDACLQLLFMNERSYQCVNGYTIEFCRNNTNGTFTNHQALEIFHVNASVGINFLALFGILLLFRISAYIFLRLIKHGDARA
ncbi:unnamed protein product [Adineta ricciae]|uniref:ABC transporter domain-containing protein n=1 Tax=Adineta ricciae TaxID=249248 RepID=A0A815DHR6_ADIRI|nr:unnamed protein product [Adineta ricciae]CAF1296526.1 unnamed protein product [Adineta ricciae]